MRSERPRIALVSYEIYEQGGAERALVETISRAHGQVDWVVLSRTLPEAVRDLVDWHRVRAPERPFRAKLGVFGLGAAARLVVERADLLHVAGPILPNRPDLVSIQFLRSAFYRTIAAPPRASTRAHVALEDWFLRRARALAAPSLWMQRELEQRFPGVPVHLTPNAVDSDRFRPGDADRAAVRRELGVADATVVALFVGNAWTMKGLPIVLEALPRVPALELWVCGSGSRERQLPAIRRLGVEQRVRFLGIRRDIERVYRGADIFVFPSILETAPLSPLEAAATGLPLVVTAVGGMEELVGDGEGGTLVERNPGAVAAALALFADDRETRVAQGEVARERARGYTWERAVSALLTVYRSLLAGRG